MFELFSCRLLVSKLLKSVSERHLKKSLKCCFDSSVRHYCDGWTDDEDSDGDLNDLIGDEEYDSIVPPHLRQRLEGHNVLLVQPRVKWGPEKTKLMSITTPELQLEEGIALIQTLDKWRVVSHLLLPTESLRKRLVFGSGTIERISNLIQRTPEITAVVMGVDMLLGFQQSELEDNLGVPVYDRFSVVLQIFNNHARSKESKLQVALAEIPYIKSRLRQLTDKGQDSALGTKRSTYGSGESYFAHRKSMLEDRAKKLQNALEKVKANRQILREKRQKMQIPMVAVVGYTNSGKTSLIKSLTRDERIVPKDVLFATLDVTVHSGMLPTLKQVLYVDTVGFICNIPTSLIEAFTATLKEVTLSDLVIHVQDISHPDIRLQQQTVVNTLKDIEVSEKLRSTMIQVGNKVDKLDDISHVEETSNILISATEGINMNVLKEEIEKRLISNTGRFFRTFRVPSGGQEAQWLRRESSIHEADADPEDNNYLLINSLINSASYGKFRRLYGNEFILEESTRSKNTV